MLNVYPLVLGPVQTTCYVVSSQGRAVIVDPAANATKIIQYLGTKKLIPEAILLTHGHFDHIGAVNELAAKYSLPIYAHKSEKEYFDQPEVNLSTMMYQPFVLSEDLDYHWLADGATLTCLDTQVKIFHVPGHTSGSLCYYFVKDRMVFTGDTLFKQSIGRTDFIYGNHQQLVTGIKQKLFTLPDDTLVYPGHGDCTTVADEKRNNPFLNY